MKKKNPHYQFDDLDTWVKFFKQKNKFPSTKITCSECKHNSTSMFGPNLKNWLKKCNNDPLCILTTFKCKACRDLEKAANPVPKPNKAKVRKVLRELTREEMEERKEKILAQLPKFKEYVPNPIDMTQDAEVCAEVTSFACWRPDIYLDYGCAECALYNNCACPIKDMSRQERKKRKAA